MKPAEVAGAPVQTRFGKPEVFPTGLVVEVAGPPTGGGFGPLFRASRFTVAPGGSTPPDTPAVPECWFIASGDARLNHDGADGPPRTGDIVTFAPNRTHRAVNGGDQELAVFCTLWDVDARP